LTAPKPPFTFFSSFSEKSTNLVAIPDASIRLPAIIKRGSANNEEFCNEKKVVGAIVVKVSPDITK